MLVSPHCFRDAQETFFVEENIVVSPRCFYNALDAFSIEDYLRAPYLN